MDYSTLLDEYLIYLRKSRQDDPNETIEEVLARHEKQLQEFALKAFGHRIKEDNIYREVVSGETIEDRPEINKVIARVQDASVKGVLVIEPSRLTRGDLLDCGTIVHVFRYTNTAIVTPMKEYDLSNKYDRKFFEMELTRGNDYLEYTKEILARGRKASALEGNYIGSIPPYGYNKVKNGKNFTLAINEKEAEFVRLVYKLYLVDGYGEAKIANIISELGAKPRMSEHFDYNGVNRILSNPLYIGKIRYNYRPVTKEFRDGKLVKKRNRNNNYILVDGHHQPIISEDLFNKAQERKGKSTKEKTTHELKNIYAGLLKCKKCGRAIGMRATRGIERYHCTNSTYCNNISSKVDIVQDAIKTALKSILSDFEFKLEQNIDDDMKSHENLIKSLTKELEQLENKQNELYDLLEDGIYTKDVFVVRNEKLASEREKLKDALKKATETIPTAVEYESKVQSLHKALDLLNDDSVSAKAKNNFLKEIIEVIYYEKDTKNSNRSDDLKNINLEIIFKKFS